MSNIAHRLRIRFGLTSEPNDYQIRDWVQKTESFVRQEHSIDDAGRLAAQSAFSDYGTFICKTEADTIAALLAAAKQK